MTSAHTSKGRWSLLLSGRLAQFNLSLLLILAAILAVLCITLRCEDKIIRYGGALVSTGLIIATVLAAVTYYRKQEARPSEGQTSSVELQGAAGQKLIVRNPPDTFLLQPQTNALMRSLLLGYDEDLCPDARVLGKVADMNYQPYSQKEREEFVQRHREQIAGKKQQANLLLQSSTEADSKAE